MVRVFTTIRLAMVLGLCLASSAMLRADEPSKVREASVKEVVEVERDQTWYRQPESSYRQDTRAIIQQKAQVRAAQRTARIASMNWYGMSNSRPTAASTPFTSMYSPVWQQPGGRPFAWNTTFWPTSVVYVR
jgi:hypothetical protein